MRARIARVFFQAFEFFFNMAKNFAKPGMAKKKCSNINSITMPRRSIAECRIAAPPRHAHRWKRSPHRWKRSPMEKVTPPMEKVTDGKVQTPPMEKFTPPMEKFRPHRWKRSDPTDGKVHRSRAVASARLMPAFILPGISLLAARFILLSKSVRLR